MLVPKFHSAICLSAIILGSASAQVEVSLPTPVVHELLQGLHFEGHEELVKAKSRAYRAFKEIINDPKSDKIAIARALGVLTLQDDDRSLFHDDAITLLQQPSPDVRTYSIRLLGLIGKPCDTVKIAGSLDADDSIIPYEAAKAMGKIGDEATVKQFDDWLGNSKKRDNQLLSKLVLKSRTEILARIEAKKPAPVGPEK